MEFVYRAQYFVKASLNTPCSEDCIANSGLVANHQR